MLDDDVGTGIRFVALIVVLMSVAIMSAAMMFVAAMLCVGHGWQQPDGQHQHSGHH